MVGAPVTRSHCHGRWGYLKEETQRWKHRYTLGQDSQAEYGVGLEREYFKNKVPAGLLQEILDAAVLFWGSAGN
jgi:hypothetical protein